MLVRNAQNMMNALHLVAIYGTGSNFSDNEVEEPLRGCTEATEDHEYFSIAVSLW